MKFIADLHLHSHYSMATSKRSNPEYLYRWACLKGITVIGTGDFTHPGWLAEIKEKLEPTEEGLYKLKPEFIESVSNEIPQTCKNEVRFLLSSEISSIYKKYGETRKIHNLILMPNFEDVERFGARLDKIGNIRSDGRPILGLDSYRLLEIALECSENLSFIPAHIWTPHFSLFGANSGFDTIEECYEELSSEIFAMETGLSSDPPMNWRLSVLDDYTLVSNSDAHSPRKLGREANLFDTDLSYYAIRNAIKFPSEGFLGTIEFYPQEGKYHYDGHRKCDVCWKPAETREHNYICSVCGRTVTVGVLHRVEKLADRPEGAKPESALPYQNLVPLPEIISEAVDVGVNTKTVRREYLKILRSLGSELTVLRETPIDEIASVAGPLIAEGVRRLRENEVTINPGFDGRYGEVNVVSPDEKIDYTGQEELFGAEIKRQKKKVKRAALPVVNGQKGEEVIGQMGKEVNGQMGKEVIGESERKRSEDSRKSPAKIESKSKAGSLARCKSLNEQQQACVEAEDGPIIIVAGPGTGKTRTLVYRIGHLISEKSVPPENILAVTFTNKAAEEMLSRVKVLTSGNPNLSKLTIGTFHSICLDILKEQDRFENYTVLGRLDSQELIRQILKNKSIKLRPAKVLDKLYFAKSNDSFEQLRESEQLFEVYEEYQQRLTDFKAFDYDDILLETVRVLETDDSLLKCYRERFQHVLVDEFQDVNAIQYKLTKLLAGIGKNLFVIGDADQAIYGFRGSDYRYFFKIQDDFADCKVFKLEQNYRSTDNILDAATKLISQNPDRIPVILKTSKPKGPKIRLIEISSELAEGIAIVKEIGRMVGGATMLQSDGQPFDLNLGEEIEHALLKGDKSFSDFAVLFRTGRQADVLEECFLKEGIPYRLLGQKSFLEAKSVRRLLAFFRTVVSEGDDFHFLNYLQMSDIDLSQSLLNKVRSVAGSKNVSLQEASKLILERPKSSSLSSLSELMDLIEKYRKLENASVEQLFRQWFEEVDLQIDKESDKFLRVASDFASVSDCLEKIVLYRGADYEVENGNKLEAVSLMTLHAAKGLEFPVVFIAGVEEGLIPYQKDKSDIDEERRLFYVGLTRAMEECVLLATRRRTRYGKQVQNEVSSFIEDIPKELIKVRKITKKRKKPEATQLELF